ncbi:MAG: Mur ligase family protein [Patescibacteria group bacterium]
MDIDLSQIKHIHIIGIGGSGISAIARMMLGEGKTVTGQDMQESVIVHDLITKGASITIGQSYEAIPADADLVVYTIAIENYDPELFKLLKSEMRIPVRSYPEMLGMVSHDKYTIAVSGTHGKTTTTGMIAQIMRDNGTDPTVIIGSLLAGGTNFIAGRSDYFVVEACEYKRSFLTITPTVLIITNIEEDHLDYYKDIEDIKSAFRELISKMPPSGFIICDPSFKNVRDVVQGIHVPVIDYAKYISPKIHLMIPGIHNKKNAAAAIAVADMLRLSSGGVYAALSNFRGTARRFEMKGNLSQGALVYDDYAHHPTEIMATLEGFRELYSRDEGWKITVVFQPHLFSRTKALLEEFGKSFSAADHVLLLPIYRAREEDDGSISSDMVARKISENGTDARAFTDFESAEEYMRTLSLDSKDIVVTMGAGEAFKVTDELQKDL